jgi:phage N-6-adenine-methyltransferase
VDVSDLIVPKSGIPTLFDPAGTRKADAKVDAIIELARKLQDWPLLEQAVDAKIAEQQAFVAWWVAAVRAPGKPKQSQTGDGLSVADAEKLTRVQDGQVSRWRRRLADPGKYRASLLGATYAAALGGGEHNHRAQGTGENEWYTPTEYIEAAREVMGGIDLDPATSSAAQRAIRAAQFFTRGDDGLSKPWAGRVWLNPPYSQPDIAHFCHKLVTEVASGAVEQAILLTHNYTDTAWFHEAESIAAAICFKRGRIRFMGADGDECAPTQGQAFFYYGAAERAFRSVFGEFGFVR